MSEPNEMRVRAAAKAIAREVGTPSDWKLWLREARAALRAAKDTP